MLGLPLKAPLQSRFHPRDWAGGESRVSGQKHNPADARCDATGGPANLKARRLELVLFRQHVS